ncbi:MAG: preprotein translocase subunit SecY [Candidatus Aenigmatarchaeota archaeon]|nr:preprotein translocase subunit SecY [Candidatus Aenigmarchaeota archaeon]
MPFDFATISAKLPAVVKPIQKMTFRDKMKWTGIILILYYALGVVTVWGINTSAVAQFEFLEIVFGSKFGSLLTLGIGPIVTASIILQLLVGSKLIGWDMQTKEGRAKFMGAQKILTVFFCFVEAIAYVVSGAIPAAAPELTAIVVLQLAAGGILIMFMDEVCSKWGFGSGVSIFIAAGVSKTIITRIFSPLSTGGEGGFAGILPQFISLLSMGNPGSAFVTFLPLISTAVVFIIVLFAQGMRVEIPMAFTFPFGKFAARRWPLKFIYTSNIPVILTAAVLANLQIVGRLLFQKGITWFGTYDVKTSMPQSGLALFLVHPSGAEALPLVTISILAGLLALTFAFVGLRMLKKWPLRMALLGGAIGALLGWGIMTVTGMMPAFDAWLLLVARALVYMLIMIIGSVIFSIFWVNTAGMDAHTVSEQFKSAMISIPGFRHDPRIIERVLERYIPALAVLGGAFIGFLAGFADLTLALGTGTGILLTVMIVHQFYEQISSQHADDMPPIMKKIVGE